MDSINPLRDILNKKAIVIISILVIIILIDTFILIFDSKTSTKKPNDEQIITSQLNQIKTAIGQEESLINKNGGEQLATVKEIDVQLRGLQKELLSLGSKLNIAEVKQAITDENKHISDQIASLDDQIKQLKKQNKDKKYLPVSALPFSVISVDIWNGEALATIRVHGVTDLMAQNDVRGGWMLVDLNFLPATVIFKNAKNQFIRVNL